MKHHTIILSNIPVVGKQSLSSLLEFLGLKNESYFTLWTHFYQDNFYETKQIRAYDIGSLIANIGGYIGMFLGYALLNLPHFFITISESVKRGFREIRGS